MTLPENATLTRPHFSRTSIQEARYIVADESQRYRPSAESPLDALARYEVNGVPVEIRRPVTRLEANLPYGYDTRVLAVVPAIALTLTPATRRGPVDAQGALTTKIRRDQVEVLNNREGESEGTLTLKVPAGWKVTPASQPFHFSRAGERALYAFDVAIPSLREPGVPHRGRGLLRRPASIAKATRPFATATWRRATCTATPSHRFGAST